ncbi:MAG: hypothetical protein NC541_11025 [bacterium]|nr:hypothetical protein [bacterium]
MKHKITYFLLSLSLLLSACSKDVSETENTWIIDDFYIYDSTGAVVNYPDNEELCYYDNVDGLKNLYEENGSNNLNYYTKRGISAHGIAKMAFAEYDLSGFYGALTKWPILGSLNESEKEIASNFFEKYPDLNEAVKHTNEISGDLALFLSAEFQVDENGNIIQLSIDEKGNPIEVDFSKDTYEIVFYIRDDNIFEWSISHRSGR